MRKIFFYFILFLCLPITTLGQKNNSKSPSADLDKYTLKNADFMERDYEKGVIYLKGRVEISFASKKLSAENAEIWYKSRLVVATGKAVIASDNFEMQGERIEYDYGNDVGNIFNGAIKSGKVTFQGEKLEKKGAEDFSADYGVYTACDCDPPTWSFTGHNIDAGVGSYAYIKWPILRVANVPIFALPYIIVPLKSSRQTGLLLPTYETTTQGGSTLGEGFFWAISPSSDATLTLKNYELRGLKSLLEYRERFSYKSQIEINGAYLNDRNVFKDERFVSFYNNLGIPIDRSYDRWYLKVNQFLELPDDYTQRAYLNFVSDLQYLVDFPQEIGGAGEPALENHYSLTKKRDDILFLIDTTMYTNLLASHPHANNDDAVHRLPEIRLSLLDRPVGNSGFSFKIDSHYVNFMRNSLAWDDVETTGNVDAPKKKKDTPDGSFSPTDDLLRTGQRLDFQPTLSYTFRVNRSLDIVPSLIYRETYYQFPVSEANFDSTLSRRYFQTNIASRFKAYRIYEGKNSRIKHEIVPEISWTNTPLIYQPDHSFFGPNANTTNFRLSQWVSDQDFYSSNKLQFDYNDRIYDRSIMTLMLLNKIIRKRTIQNTNDYRQIGTIRLWQTYDFIEANRVRGPAEGTNKPWSEISTLFDFRFDNFETNSVFQYYPYHNVIDSSVRMKVFNDAGNFAEVTYTQKFEISDIKTDVDYGKRKENISPRLGLSSKYLNLAGGPDYNFVSQTVNSWSADVGLKPPGNCILFSIQFVKPVGVAGVSVSTKFNMSFDGT